MTRKLISSGSPFEREIGYSRMQIEIEVTARRRFSVA
jgi:hypothetical protein